MFYYDGSYLVRSLFEYSTKKNKTKQICEDTKISYEDYSKDKNYFFSDNTYYVKVIEKFSTPKNVRYEVYNIWDDKNIKYAQDPIKKDCLLYSLNSKLSIDLKLRVLKKYYHNKKIIEKDLVFS